jgi:hypothetical protein
MATRRGLWTNPLVAANLSGEWIRRELVMRFLMLIAVSAVVSSAAPAQLSLSAQVTSDVQCFMLYSVGVATATEDKNRTAGTLGVMYFVGKLQAEAPGLDLVTAVREQAQTFENNPRLKEIGAACDAEFHKRGEELLEIGKELQQGPATPSPST